MNKEENVREEMADRSRNPIHHNLRWDHGHGADGGQRFCGGE